MEKNDLKDFIHDAIMEHRKEFPKALLDEASAALAEQVKTPEEALTRIKDFARRANQLEESPHVNAMHEATKDVENTLTLAILGGRKGEELEAMVEIVVLRLLNGLCADKLFRTTGQMPEEKLVTSAAGAIKLAVDNIVSVKKNFKGVI